MYELVLLSVGGLVRCTSWLYFQLEVGEMYKLVLLSVGGW